MNGLKALERIKKLSCVWDADNDDFRDVEEIVPNAVKTIEKELTNYNEIKVRLALIRLKVASKKEELLKNLKNCGEYSSAHSYSELSEYILEWFDGLLDEVTK